MAKTIENTYTHVKEVLTARAEEITRLETAIQSQATDEKAAGAAAIDAAHLENLPAYKAEIEKRRDAADTLTFYRERLDYLKSQPLEDPETIKATSKGLQKEAAALEDKALKKWIPIFEKAYHEAEALEAELMEYNAALTDYQTKIAKIRPEDSATIWQEYETAEMLYSPICENYQKFEKTTGKKFLPFTRTLPHGAIIEK